VLCLTFSEWINSELYLFDVNLALVNSLLIRYHILAARNSTHAMVTHFGKLQEFWPESDSVKSDSIKSYLQRVTLYFEANEIDAKKQVAVLLTSIGALIYTLLSDLLAPSTPGEQSLEAISKALLDHFEPKHSIITCSSWLLLQHREAISKDHDEAMLMESDNRLLIAHTFSCHR